jgi:hypothetical protein
MVDEDARQRVSEVVANFVRICTLAPVVRSSRRLVMRLSAAFLLALVVADVASGMAGALDVLLYAAPFVLIAALLLSGRFVGEERILAVYRALPRPKRRTAQRWPSRPEVAFSAALERAPWSLRGPPAGVALA